MKTVQEEMNVPDDDDDPFDDFESQYSLEI